MKPTSLHMDDRVVERAVVMIFLRSSFVAFAGAVAGRVPRGKWAKCPPTYRRHGMAFSVFCFVLAERGIVEIIPY